MSSRWAVPVAGLVLVFGLTACGSTTASAVHQAAAAVAPATNSTPLAAKATNSTPLAASKTSSTPQAAKTADPLAAIDRQLATVDGAAAQSQGDITAGDAAASTNDDGQ